jgi:hypothetical protein
MKNGCHGEGNQELPLPRLWPLKNFASVRLLRVGVVPAAGAVVARVAVFAGMALLSLDPLV